MWNDVRYSARAFTREPGLAAIAILTLALGVGANTAIFSVVNGVLLRPLGYRQPGSLVVVNEIVPELSHLYPLFPVNARHFQTWVEKCTAFEHLSLVKAGDLNITGSGEPERL